MQRIVVISSNNNPDYLYFAKWQERAWNKLGWQLCVMITHDVNALDLELIPREDSDKPTLIVQLPEIKGLKTGTIAQAGRLYAANYLPDDALIMTCDIDLIPLSDYWHPDPFDVTVYGHDLTWHSFFPMGYCAMSGKNWKKYMELSGLTYEDMVKDSKSGKSNYNPYSDVWEQYWDYDWSLLTNKLMPYKSIIKFIDRGQIDIAGATLAKGRIDRHNIEDTRNQAGPFIDMHYHNTSLRNDRRDIVFEEIFNKFYP